MIDVPPPADDIPGHLGDLVQWLNYLTDVPPVIASAIAPVWSMHMCPILDGPGRRSRLLSMLHLDRAGYGITRLVATSE